jgi:hypothetical protein
MTICLAGSPPRIVARGDVAQHHDQLGEPTDDGLIDVRFAQVLRVALVLHVLAKKAEEGARVQITPLHDEGGGRREGTTVRGHSSRTKG